MNEPNASRVSLAVHTVAGVIAGYTSVLLDRVIYSFGLAILILLITGYVTEFLLKKKGMKWWMGNGGVLYILVWLVTWIYFFNMV